MNVTCNCNSRQSTIRRSNNLVVSVALAAQMEQPWLPCITIMAMITRIIIELNCFDRLYGVHEGRVGSHYNVGSFLWNTCNKHPKAHLDGQDHVESCNFTRGQFWAPGIVVACICLSVCLSVCPYVCQSRAWSAKSPKVFVMSAIGT